MYTKLQNFIQLSLTKLCCIKCDHLVNFYSSLENGMSLWQYDRSPYNLARWCRTCLKCAAHFKNPRWVDSRYARETRSTARYCKLSIFNMVAVRHLGISTLKFLTANHSRDSFCVITLNFVEIGLRSNCSWYIAFFVFFKWNVKIPRWSRLIWNNFVNVRYSKIKFCIFA